MQLSSILSRSRNSLLIVCENSNSAILSLLCFVSIPVYFFIQFFVAAMPHYYFTGKPKENARKPNQADGPASKRRQEQALSYLQAEVRELRSSLSKGCPKSKYYDNFSL